MALFVTVSFSLQDPSGQIEVKVHTRAEEESPEGNNCLRIHLHFHLHLQLHRPLGIRLHLLRLYGISLLNGIKLL